MKAVVFRGPRKVAVEQVDDARIESPTDVLVRISTAGICGSDLHMYEGRTAAKPGVVLGPVDMRERRLLRDGQVVPLRPKVFDVLIVLVQNGGRFLSKEELIKQVWRDTVVEEGNLTRNISTLRNALGERPSEAKFIETVPWQGYRFVAAVKELTDEPARRSITSLAVLPFVNVAGDPDLDYLADGIAEALISSRDFPMPTVGAASLAITAEFHFTG